METFSRFVHQELDDLPNISYVGSFFLACVVFPAQPFQTTPCPLKRHAQNHTGSIAMEPSTNILYAGSQSVKNVLFHSFCTPMHEMAGFHISPQSWETLAANRNRLRWRASLSFGYSFIVSHKLCRKKGEAPSSSSIKTGWAMMYAHMHLNYGAISGSHAYRDCVWHIILDAGLYTT